MTTAWEPIETAPKDGTRVIVWRPDDSEFPKHTEHASVDLWKDGVWWLSRRYQQPTHWMPLPPPPNQSERAI